MFVWWLISLVVLVALMLVISLLAPRTRGEEEPSAGSGRGPKVSEERRKAA